MLLNEFNDITKITKNWYFFVFFEFKLLIFPSVLDTIKFSFNFSLFLGTINEFSDLFSISVKLKFDQIIKAKVY